MTVVALDTNILLQDPTARGAHMRRLLIGCKRCGIPLAIPEVVLDELYGNHREHLTQHLRKIEASARELIRFGMDYARPTIDVEKQAEAYHQRMATEFEKFDVQILAYPKVSPQDLIRASYNNRKPFKSTGEGHKDYLVFLTLISIFGDAQKDVKFISHNRKDFCGADGTLHADLAAMLPNGCTLTVYESAQALYSDFLAAEVQKLGPLDDPDALVTAIKNGTFPGFDLNDRLEAVLIRELVDEHPDLEAMSTPLNDLSAHQLLGFEIADVEVSALDEGLLSIDLGGKVELEVFGFMDKSDYFGAEDDLGVCLADADWNDYVVSAYDTVSSPFKVSLIFDQTEHEIKSADIELC